MLRKKTAKQEERSGPGIPELGPGLTTELPVVEKPGELEGGHNEQKKEWRRREVHELPEQT